MRPGDAVHVEVHASQTEPKLCGLHVLSRHVLPRCFMAAFTSAFALCPQATHTKVAWLLRLWAAMCLQGLQVCDVYAALTFSTLPGAFCSSRAARSPHPDLRMPRLSPAFRATFLPGFSTVPCADRVMLLTLRFSTRITSNLRARSVLVFWAQSLRRSPSLAFSPAIR